MTFRSSFLVNPDFVNYLFLLR